MGVIWFGYTYECPRAERGYWRSQRANTNNNRNKMTILPKKKGGGLGGPKQPPPPPEGEPVGSDGYPLSIAASQVGNQASILFKATPSPTGPTPSIEYVRQRKLL